MGAPMACRPPAGGTHQLAVLLRTGVMMFKECQIRLTQKLRGYNETWLFVKLLEARIPVMREGEFYDFPAKLGGRIKTFTYWGRWRTGPSSKMPNQATDAFSIGSNLGAPKVWVYNAHAKALSFLNLEGPSNLQLGYDNTPEVIKENVGLYDAAMTGSGIVPVSNGWGQCQSSTVFQQGPIAWKPDRTALPHY
jgi:hypothetical protein